MVLTWYIRLGAAIVRVAYAAAEHAVVQRATVQVASAAAAAAVQRAIVQVASGKEILFDGVAFPARHTSVRRRDQRRTANPAGPPRSH